MRDILIFVPAYNAEKTISGLITEIKILLPGSFILVVDDGSSDNTLMEAQRTGVKIISHGKNLGYGATQKTAFRFFLSHGFKNLLMIHADAQHDPVYLKDILSCLENGYDLVIGSRMKNRLDALKGGMPLLKFISNVMLTYVENRVTNLRLSEYHSGYRGFSSRIITDLYNSGFMELMSDGFLFDQQIIFFAAFRNLKICDIPVSTRYDEFSRQIGMKEGTKYVLETLIISFRYFLFKQKILHDFRKVIKPVVRL